MQSVLWKVFSLVKYPAEFQTPRLEMKLEILRLNERLLYESKRFLYDTGHSLETKIMVIPIYLFDFMKLVCVQNTFEFLNTSAVRQNVVAWLLTLLLLMTIVNLKRFSWVLSEARTHTQCHLNFFNEFKRMITVINFEALCYVCESRIYRRNYLYCKFAVAKATSALLNNFIPKYTD